MKVPFDFWVPPANLWPGETVAVLGSGPSLTVEQTEQMRGRCRVIAVNRAYVLAPWADWLFGSDASKFWKWCAGPARINQGEPDALEFAGTKITLWNDSALPEQKAAAVRLAEQGVKVVRHRLPIGGEWFDPEPGCVRGTNGVHHMLNLLGHLGPRRVLLLGVDMHPGHFHEPWPDGVEPFYTPALHQLGKLVVPLRDRDVEVVNCTPGSACKHWPMADLADVWNERPPVGVPVAAITRGRSPSMQQDQDPELLGRKQELMQRIERTRRMRETLAPEQEEEGKKLDEELESLDRQLTDVKDQMR